MLQIGAHLPTQDGNLEVLIMLAMGVKMSQHRQIKLSRRCSPALAHVRFSILDHSGNLEMLRVLDFSKKVFVVSWCACKP
jgi:hypothetical protein